MKIIKPFVRICESECSTSKLRNVEKSARLCYKSEDMITEDSYRKFLTSILLRGHDSVIEHEKVTVYFTVDRGVSHEIVRHRIGSYSQESTRYCNYASQKFNQEITVIEPFYFLKKEEHNIWKNTCEYAEKAYLNLLSTSTPQEARSVLPNSLKTEIATTYNFREWRHFFSLRCASNAHPQMQQVSIPLLLFFKNNFSPIFDDIDYNSDFDAKNYAEIILEKD